MAIIFFLVCTSYSMCKWQYPAASFLFLFFFSCWLPPLAVLTRIVVPTYTPLCLALPYHSAPLSSPAAPATAVAAKCCPNTLMSLLFPWLSLLSMINHRHLPPPSLLVWHLPLIFSSIPHLSTPPTFSKFPSLPWPCTLIGLQSPVWCSLASIKESMGVTGNWYYMSMEKIFNSYAFLCSTKWLM